MATTTESTMGREQSQEPIYVYEVPVRVWHWVHAIAIVVLCVTGYSIAHPLPSLGGEASDHFVMGTFRLVHFISAMVFAIGMLVRFYWAIVGNEYARELVVLPVWSGEWWKRVWHEVKFYSFLTRKASKNVGHNPLAQLSLWVINVFLGIFMACTGFALYSQGTGAGSWADLLFGWVFVIEPSSQAVRMWHYIGMWVWVFFVITHIYVILRLDFASRQNGISGMIDGYRRFKDDGPMSPQ